MQKARVLIVDDEIELCQTQKMILEELWEKDLVFTAYSGIEALSVLENENIDVLVTDIRMPGMDGIELMKQVKKKYNDIQIIVLTGHGDIDNAIAALRLGAHNYLTKPVFAEVFHFAVKNAWEKSNEIKERKRTEQALRESEKRYRTLFNNASDAIFVHDFEKNLTDVNRVACERLGYNCEDLLKMKIDEIVSSDFSAILPKHLESIIRNGHIVFETEHVKKDGVVIPIELSSRVIEYEGKPAIFSIARDISDRKKAEKEQAKLHDQIRHAQKMESVGTLAGGIAHDFNNILCPIIGYTEMAMEATPPEHNVSSYLEEIFQASYRAKELVQQIVTFSRQHENEKMPIFIHLIVKEVLKLMRATIPSTIEIKQSIEKCGPVMADAGQIYQVVLNLCTNAYQAMLEQEGTGILEMSLEETVSINSISSSDRLPGELPKGKYAKLSCKDTGHGIAPEILEKIFDPYFTTKKKGKGTGLGLSVVHGIINNHTGQLKVLSTPGKGTTFEIFLPVIKESQDVKNIISDSSIPSGDETILLVDDEEQIAKLLKHMLMQMGYQVTSRTSSIEALKAFKAQPEKFDLVITDATMPNMDGIELSQELIRIRQDIPIIICTGFSETITQDKALNAGIKEYIMKPVVKKNLAETIRRVLKK
ncbi:response regulator, partial [Desulfobacterales bacterium HSG17]|nr:response regulator [Desulfobacterales bacterium HSG17]